MNQLYKSFCGIDTIEENRQRKRDQEVPPIKIVFPSYDTVLNSKLGPSVSKKKKKGKVIGVMHLT